MGKARGDEGMLQNLTSPDVSGIAGVKIPDVAQTFVPRAVDAESGKNSAAQFPLGGLGAAWVVRSPDGSFRFRCPLSKNQPKETITAFPISGCQFAVFEQVEGKASKAYALAPSPSQDQSLSQWQWYPASDSGADNGTANAAIHHLYPRSWYSYGGVFQSQILCDQLSPILPGNYQESSYPVAVFEWRFYNPNDVPVTLSVMLSWENLIGSVVGDHNGSPTLKFNQSGGNFNRWVEDFFRVGCTLMNTQALGSEGYLTTKEAPPVNQGQWAIVTAENPAVEVFHHTRWRPDGDGSDLWDSFAGDGSLPNENGEAATEPGERLGAAIAVRFTVRPGRSRTIPFILSWDLPTSSVETAPVGPMPYRFTDFFGRDGQNAWYMARTALKHYDTWRSSIDQWQQSVAIAGSLSKASIVDNAEGLGSIANLRTAAINGLHQLASDLAPWTAADELHPRGQLWTGDRSRFRDTWALHKLWPDLEQSQIRSALTQSPKTLTEAVHLILRLHRSHKADPNFIELAELWAVLTSSLESLLGEWLDNSTQSDTGVIDLVYPALEAAIAMTQDLLDHQVEWLFTGHTSPVSPAQLATSIDTYTQLRQQGDNFPAPSPKVSDSMSTNQGIELWGGGVSLESQQ
ncbi:MAG: GH116 family glycosyl-hydrolase [Cyanobacteria bacterium P01_C01_bin.89]